MFLQSLQIEGFRSLKSVTWKPGRLNVLIGPNGGGKSNLLRALDLIRVAAAGELRETILRMGGMAPLVWDEEANRIRFQLSVPMLSYEFELRQLGKGGGYLIGVDEMTSLDDRGNRKTVFNGLTQSLVRKFAGIHPPASEKFTTEIRLSRLTEYDLPELLPLGAFELQYALESYCVYTALRTDQSAELRRATVTRQEKRVEPDGQNLIAVLSTLYQSDRQFEEFLDNAMASAFPDDYEKLTFPPAEDGRTQLRVRRKHRKRADRAADLSDGTLRFLLLMTILGSPDPAPLIAIDEPETGLHPRMLPIIAAVAENAAMKTQVILSTHSPEFLDAFRDEPPTTTVVTSDGSETKLANIDGDQLKQWLKEYSLGRFAFSGTAEAIT